jgi:hypothetical protein
VRTPAELYETLWMQRRLHGPHDMLLYPLMPPLLREESDALQLWLESESGPCRDQGMVAALQHHWFTIHQGGRAAAAARWLHCGGRALHAFVGDSDVPLCGVVAARADGTAPRWRYGTRRSRHGDCARAARDGGHPS